MTVDERDQIRRTLRTAGRLFCSVVLTALASCGGSLGNPPTVSNPTATGRQKLAYAYFQRCINPIFFTNFGGNECGSSGCHAPTGTGGTLRVLASATALDVLDPANTPDVIRATDMYKDYTSAAGVVIIGDPASSRLIDKPLTRGFFHGGGQIFSSDQDPNIKTFEYWITHPAPVGQDEFSTATYSMFTNNDPNGGQCITQ
jgi:hypothetical protein